jgi:hypothetical protein
MRSKIIYLLAFILVGAIACEKKVEIVAEEKVDIAAEEEAIKAVLHKQLVVVSNQDYEGEAAVWAHEPYIVRHSGDSYIVGWDSLSIFYKTWFGEVREKLKEDPEYLTMREYRASNFDIHLNGNVAFVFFDEHYDYTWEGEDYSGVSRGLKYLEKKEGEWRIVAVLPGR